MIEFIYFVVIVMANTVGTLSGMGGGVLIKPILDAIGAHSLTAITFYSSVAVFAMALVSTARRLKSGFEVQKKFALATPCLSGCLFFSQTVPPSR